jgi:hypothetical protein
MTGLATKSPDLLDDTRGVGHRLGIGHRVHRGETTERRGAGPRLDSLGVLAARLTQVSVQVDQSGQRDQPCGVEHSRAGRRQARTYLLDASIADQEVRNIATERCTSADQPAFRHATNSDPTG